MSPSCFLLDSNPGVAVIIVFLLIFGLLYLAFLGAVFYAAWKMFGKAGKPGWTALVPIYNLVVLHEIVGRDPIRLLLLFVPLLGVYFAVTLYISLARSFGKREVTDYVLTIFFAPFFLGLGTARYEGPVEGGSSDPLFADLSNL